MYGRRKILDALYSQAPAEGAAQGGGQGQQTPAQQAGVADHSAAAAALNAQGQQQAPATDDKPAGYVPVGELATERQKRHTLEQEVATLKASNEQTLAAIKAAFGLGDANTPEQLKAAAETATGQAKAAQIQLSIFQHAKDAGGDPHKLLDSASFLQSISTLDPTNADAVKTAIKAAVEANKDLAPRVTGGSRDAGQGSGGNNQAPTMSDLIRAAAGK